MNGVAKRMSTHSAIDPPGFPVTVCERSVTGRAQRIRVGSRKLRSPPPDPRRIVVFGDTGCRLAAPSHFQACNDPAQWPFAQVARGIARWKPEMVVHVGDYVYRESPCPAGNAGCAGSPHGDNWPTWEADFFDPARPALKAAPWVFIRGNHEDCAREGDGWFRLLDPRPMPPACQDVTEPFAIRLARLKLLMLDSSSASDFPPFNPGSYADQFAALDGWTGKRKAWFLSHKPVWGLASINGGTDYAPTNTTLQEASGNALSPRVQMALAGHLHNFELLGFGGGRRPPQIVSGGGGTMLDAPLTKPVLGADIAGTPVSEGAVLTRFGFMTLVRARGGRSWTATIRDPGGEPLLSCRVAGGSLAC